MPFRSLGTIEINGRSVLGSGSRQFTLAEGSRLGLGEIRHRLPTGALLRIALGNVGADGVPQCGCSVDAEVDNFRNDRQTFVGRPSWDRTNDLLRSHRDACAVRATRRSNNNFHPLVERYQRLH